MEPLTKKQEEVYDFMFHFFEENDQIPPMAEIADHFGWASPNAANEHVLRIRDAGWIEHNAVGKYRFTR